MHWLLVWHFPIHQDSGGSHEGTVHARLTLIYLTQCSIYYYCMLCVTPLRFNSTVELFLYNFEKFRGPLDASILWYNNDGFPFRFIFMSIWNLCPQQLWLSLFPPCCTTNAFSRITSQTFLPDLIRMVKERSIPTTQLVIARRTSQYFFKN